MIKNIVLRCSADEEHILPLVGGKEWDNPTIIDAGIIVARTGDDNFEKVLDLVKGSEFNLKPVNRVCGVDLVGVEFEVPDCFRAVGIEHLILPVIGHTSLKTFIRWEIKSIIRFMKMENPTDDGFDRTPIDGDFRYRFYPVVEEE